MNRGALGRGAIVLAVVAFCVAGFFACYEQREVEIETGASKEARENRYLALSRLLERMGHETVVKRELALLDELPEPPATLILVGRRDSLSAARSQALLDWVARGGHLAVVAHSLWEDPDEDEEEEEELRTTQGADAAEPRPDRRDLLLDPFGIQRWRADPHAESELAREAAADAAESDPTAAPEATASHATEAAADGPHEEAGGESAEPDDDTPNLRELLSSSPETWFVPKTERADAWLDDLEEPLDVGFDPSFQLFDRKDEADWTLAGAAGVHLIEVLHGEGKLSALSGSEPLSNSKIASRDNAEFAVRWLRAWGNGPIWIVTAEDWPSFLVLVQRHASAAIAGCAALLLLWLWRSLFRFGPLLPAPDPARRRWLEHLEASGRFHWRQDRGRELLESLRGTVLRALERKHPSWSRAPERERLERVAHTSGLPLELVMHAFLGTPAAAKSFVSAVRALERIRASL